MDRQLGNGFLFKYYHHCISIGLQIVYYENVWSTDTCIVLIGKTSTWMMNG